MWFGRRVTSAAVRPRLRRGHTRVARSVLRAFNRQGGFDNLSDTEDALREILGASFQQVEVEAIGSIAVFVATRPRTDSSEAPVLWERTGGMAQTDE